MVSLAFEPINRIHSLVEMVLVLEFPGPIPAATLQRARSLKNDLSTYLPRVEDVHAFQVVVENGVTRGGNLLDGGFQMSSYKTDGSVGAMARISENVISVHWLQYERWAGAKKFVQRVLDLILSRLRGGPLLPSSIGLKFIDQFVCEDEKAYDASLLFSADGEFIPKFVYSSGTRWHSHTGSFGVSAEGRDLLMQLNIDSAMQTNGATSRALVNVDHTLSLRPVEPDALLPYMGYSGTGLEWTALLDELHERNKSLLKSILHESIQRRIGLVRDEESKSD